MISTLIITVCLATDLQGNCTEREAEPRLQWSGPTAPTVCQMEADHKNARLQELGATRWLYYCESQPGQEL